MEDITKGYGVEVELVDSFLAVIETLSRIGIESKKERNTLFQSCNILKKQDRYFILHFKELFGLDGKPCTLDDSDVQRRNRIINLLVNWGLVRVKDKEFENWPMANMSTIKVVKYTEKQDWKFVQKYTIGKR
jgi:hypothetical protein